MEAGSIERGKQNVHFPIQMADVCLRTLSRAHCTASVSKPTPSPDRCIGNASIGCNGSGIMKWCLIFVRSALTGGDAPARPHLMCEWFLPSRIPLSRIGHCDTSPHWVSRYFPTLPPDSLFLPTSAAGTRLAALTRSCCSRAQKKHQPDVPSQRRGPRQSFLPFSQRWGFATASFFLLVCFFSSSSLLVLAFSLLCGVSRLNQHGSDKLS